MDICGLMETSAYSPLSFAGPSRSIPSVLPSRENEWQLAQVCIPVRSSRLLGSAMLRSRQATRGSRLGASGLITPFCSLRGHQRDVAEEDRRAHRILRGLNHHRAAGDGVVKMSVPESGDGDGRGMLSRVPA